MDPSATAGFIGLTLATTRQEMLRSLLESIAFSQKQLVEAFLSETDYKFEKLIVDGGVARNDFILQMISNLTGRKQGHLRLAVVPGVSENYPYHLPGNRQTEKDRHVMT